LARWCVLHFLTMADKKRAGDDMNTAPSVPRHYLKGDWWDCSFCVEKHEQNIRDATENARRKSADAMQTAHVYGKAPPHVEVLPDEAGKR
jgi:hypothetical protein